MMPPDDSDLMLIEEDGPDEAPLRGDAWRILIVDDDPEVHEGTVFALKDEVMLGRGLAFLHAYSATEARQVLVTERDIAVILLDVVMERVDTGLDLVRIIRTEIGLLEPRIILRTGQPGYAPETEAIRLFDINDYRTKSELTHTRLLTSVMAAVRAYVQILSLSRQRHGLQKIIDASPGLYEKPAIDLFAEGVILQIGNLLHIEPEGILCVEKCGTDEKSSEKSVSLRLIGATGRYRGFVGSALNQVPEKRAIDALVECVARRDHTFGNGWTALYIRPAPDRDGAVFLDTPTVLPDADRQLLSVFCTNIVGGLRNVKLLEELRNLAYFDRLSGLPNRSCFLTRLDEHIASGHLDFTVAIVDIDHFSDLNDAIGHANGDRVLHAVGLRLRAGLDDDCLVARVASDNFAIFGPPAKVNPAMIGRLFEKPFAMPDFELPVSVTMGLATLSESATCGPDALKAASIALKRAKIANRGHHEYYTREMEDIIRARIEIHRDLRQVLQKRGLAVFYQPQIELATGRLVGTEALVRWRRNDGEFVPPDQFIQVAENTGLIIDLGEFIITESCRQVAKWRDEGLGDIRMAINVSIAQFRSRHFLPFVADALATAGISGSSVEIEITESMVMNEVESVIETLSALRQLGISVAVDDFGTGFSSLNYLQRLPIDRLKVDRAFVRDIGSGGRGEIIAQLIVQLGKMLGLQIIGEGIESEIQAAVLRSWGCHEGQGFLYSQAVDPIALADWINRHGRNSPLPRRGGAAGGQKPV